MVYWKLILNGLLIAIKVLIEINGGDMVSNNIMVDRKSDCMIIYYDNEGDLHVWTIPFCNAELNLKSMKKRGVDIVGVYKKLNDSELLEELFKY